MKIKTNFKPGDVTNAIIEMYRARLVAGWTGCLKLERNKKHIVLTQYPSSSSWIRGYETISIIHDWFSWGEIEGFFARTDGKIEISTFDAGIQGEYYDHVVIVTKTDAFERLIACDFFESAICEALAQ